MVAHRDQLQTISGCGNNSILIYNVSAALFSTTKPFFNDKQRERWAQFVIMFPCEKLEQKILSFVTMIHSYEYLMMP